MWGWVKVVVEGAGGVCCEQMILTGHSLRLSVICSVLPTYKQHAGKLCVKHLPGPPAHVK